MTVGVSGAPVRQQLPRKGPQRVTRDMKFVQTKTTFASEDQGSVDFRKTMRIEDTTGRLGLPSLRLRAHDSDDGIIQWL